MKVYVAIGLVIVLCGCYRDPSRRSVFEIADQIGTTNGVISMTVGPSGHDASVYQFFDVPITITSKEKLEPLRDILKQFRKYRPNHPSVQWHCRLVVDATTFRQEFSVHRLTDGKAMIYDRGKIYISDDLANYLMTLKRKEKSQDTGE